MIDPEENANLRPCDRDLLKACSDLDEEGVRAALDAGADPNCHDRFEWPLLACLHGSGFERWFWGWTDADDDDDDDDESVDAAKCEEYERESDLRRIRIFTILLDRGADINLNIGDDLLWHAVHNSPEIVEFLLSRGADPNCESDNGQNHDMNPLSHAWTDETVYRSDPEASKSYATIGRMLLSYGARPEWSGDFKETAVDLEKIRSFEDVPPLVHPALPENVKPLCAGMRDVDAALVFACQRLDYYNVQLAEKLGGDLSIRDGNRSLPVVVLDDAPQLCGKRFADNGWNLEDAVTDFLLFLLVGMKTPVDGEQAERILRACVDNGYADTMRVLVRHHSLGPAFKSAASSMDVNAYPWDCWPEGKRKEMAAALFEHDFPRESTQRDSGLKRLSERKRPCPPR